MDIRKLFFKSDITSSPVFSGNLSKTINSYNEIITTSSNSSFNNTAWNSSPTEHLQENLVSYIKILIVLNFVVILFLITFGFSKFFFLLSQKLNKRRKSFKRKKSNNKNLEMNIVYNPDSICHLEDF